jgi:hypothetical protein
MSEAWPENGQGVLTFPSGRRIRGRGLRRPVPSGPPPEFGLYLTGKRPPDQPWPSRWVKWPDFWLPSSSDDARSALLEAWRTADDRRVEIACGGGVGRTGTALACLAVLDGVPADQAVDFVRRQYSPRAVETPWQRRFARRFAG